MAKRAEYQKLLDAEPQDQLARIILARERRRQRARRFFRCVLFIVIPVFFFFSFFGKTVPGFGPGCHHQSDVEEVFLQTPSDSCGSDFHKTHDGSYPLAFSSDRSVHFLQKRGNDRHRGRKRHNVQVSGLTRVVRSLSSEGKSKIDLRIEVNSDDIEVYATWDAESQRLRVVVDDLYDDHDADYPRPCVDIQAVIHVPADAELENLKVDVTSLDVDVEEKLGLTAKETIITTISGHIHFGSHAIKEGSRIGLTTISGNIRANVPLLEQVDSFSASGHNYVDVSRPGKWREFDTSALNVHSISGNIKVRDPIDEGEDIPAADYIRKVTTISGKVDAALFFSSRVELSAQPSGDLDASLQPVLHDKLSGDREDEVLSKLDSTTVSGNVRIQVLEPSWIGKSDKKWTLRSSHSAISGNIEIRLPDAWEGGFSTRSLTGRIDVRGKDVQLGTRDEKREVDEMTMKAISGHKGDGHSTTDVHTTTGNIKLIVGHE